MSRSITKSNSDCCAQIQANFSVTNIANVYEELVILSKFQKRFTKHLQVLKFASMPSLTEPPANIILLARRENRTSSNSKKRLRVLSKKMYLLSSQQLIKPSENENVALLRWRWSTSAQENTAWKLQCA